MCCGGGGGGSEAAMEEGGTNGAHYVSGQESARWRLCNGKRRWRVQAGKPDTLVKRTRGARLLYNGDLAAAAAVELNQGRRSNGPCTPTVQPRRSGLPAAQKRVLTVLPEPGMLNDTAATWAARTAACSQISHRKQNRVLLAAPLPSPLAA